MPFVEARVDLAEIGNLFRRNLVVIDLRIAAAGYWRSATRSLDGSLST